MSPELKPTGRPELSKPGESFVLPDGFEIYERLPVDPKRPSEQSSFRAIPHEAFSSEEVVDILDQAEKLSMIMRFDPTKSRGGWVSGCVITEGENVKRFARYVITRPETLAPYLAKDSQSVPEA